MATQPAVDTGSDVQFARTLIRRESSALKEIWKTDHRTARRCCRWAPEMGTRRGLGRLEVTKPQNRPRIPLTF
jgi:hypothetical protein